MISNMPKFMPFFTVVLLVLLSETSFAQVKSTEDGIKPSDPISEMHARKMLAEVRLDYDNGGYNTKHDPPKGKPGIGGKSP